MNIKYYGYNAFLIESDGKVIAIDPGNLFFYWFRFTTLFPESEWHRITYIFITHGDPDHYWHADRIAKASNFTRTYNPADDELFKREVEKTGAKCVILHDGDSIDLSGES
ncbi:MAG: MBL fold metallo-hydrolase [Pseudomonadota bacterium]